MEFGHWFKQRRQALVVTQEAVAEAVSYSVDTIRKIESGKRRPSRQLAELLADYFNVPQAERATFVQWARGAHETPAPTNSRDIPEQERDTEPSTLSSLTTSSRDTPTSGYANAVTSAETSDSSGSSLPPAPGTSGSTEYPIPAAPTPLIGRGPELAEIRVLLWRSSTRLVTLIGPPGIGKTRLALAVAMTLKDDFKDGLVYVPLIGITDPALVVPTLLQALRIRESDETHIEALQKFLRDKQMLIVLDNFEQIVAAAPILAQIMSAAARVKLLVTSRSPLHIRGEKLMNVPPLALPNVDHMPTTEEMARTEAVALFVERVQDALGSFALTDENAPVVAAICVELDGLPLAIELAAAKSRVLSLQALHTRLIMRSGKLSLLTGGARDAPAHQQTLRHSVESSYMLLGEEEQKLFRRLGIFAGPFDFEMAEAVAGATLEGLEAVLDQSLVRRQQTGGAKQASTEGARFALLASIREYALEQLDAAGETEALSLAHARYFLDLAEMGRPNMAGPNQFIWMSRWVAVQADIRAALAWGLGQGKQIEGERAEVQFEGRGIALQIAAKLIRFWERHAGVTEGRRWLEEALAQSRGQPAEWRAFAYYVLGTFLWMQTDLVGSQKYLEESIVLYKEVNNLPHLSRAYNNLANVFYFEGKYEEARALYSESLALGRQFGARSGVAHSLSNLGDIALMEGDYNEAEKLHLEGLAIFREINSPSDVVTSLSNLAETMQARGDFTQAKEYASECLALSRELGAEHTAAMALTALGEAVASLGEQERALHLTAESLQTFIALGDKQLCLEALEVLAGILVRAGQPLPATRIFGALNVLRGAILVPLNPNKRIIHNEGVEIARETLSALDFQAAWAVGQAMSMDEVAQYSNATILGEPRP